MSIETGNITIQLPARLYAELQSLAVDEQTDPVEIVARLVATARQRRAWLQDLTALREEISRDGGLLAGVTKDEAVDRLRQTRREIFEACYAHLYE